jgi:[ribosomal protein S5]-alanine N-acetyltransferase
MLGSIGFWRIDAPNYRAEIGYMLQQQAQGRGYIHEAIRAALHYGFEMMGLHSVEAHTSPDNTASQRVLKKLEFVQEALLRENFYFNGVFSDTHVFALLAREFKP